MKTGQCIKFRNYKQMQASNRMESIFLRGVLLILTDRREGERERGIAREKETMKASRNHISQKNYPNA